MNNPLLLPIMFDALHFTNLPLLNFSRMNNQENQQQPPPYIAALLQQFETNRRLNENLVARLERNTAQYQPGSITLPDFLCINHVVYRSSTNPLDADDWLCDITLNSLCSLIFRALSFQFRYSILNLIYNFYWVNDFSNQLTATSL